MVKFLLAATLTLMLTSVVLAQSGGAAPPPGAAVADGPLLGPPTINIPDASGPPVPPPTAGAGQKTQPRWKRLPPTTEEGKPAGGKLLGGRWRQRPPTEAAPPAATPTPADAAPEFEGAAAQAAPLPSVSPPAPKRLFNSKKIGSVELFPRPKEGDRQGNPLSLRRPVLAW